MKKTLFSILFILPLFILSGCTNQNQSNSGAGKNIEIARTGTYSNNDSLNIPSNDTNNTPENNQSSDNNTQNPPPEQEKKEPTETTLYEFSTPIKSKAANRLNNIKITCSSLNETSVNNGEEFSFCKTIGQASESKGYKKADVIVNKQVIQAIGGGMCQVSSTLYNAALGVQGIQITERHAHDKPVNYVEKGKDATISYGVLDLKFVNNTGNTIKIYANADDGANVYVKIVSIT